MFKDDHCLICIAKMKYKWHSCHSYNHESGEFHVLNKKLRNPSCMPDA